MLSENVKKLIVSLAMNETMTFNQFVQEAGVSGEDVAIALDLLLQTRIFDASVEKNAEIPSIVYMFTDNENSQKMYNAILEQLKGKQE